MGENISPTKSSGASLEDTPSHTSSNPPPRAGPTSNPEGWQRQRKRISGAEQRRRRAAKERAVATQATPANRLPTASPATATASSQGSKSKKRLRSDESAPSPGTNPRKRMQTTSAKVGHSSAKAKAIASYKEAANSHLRVVIANKHNQLGKVTAEMAASVKSILTARLKKAIEDQGFVPTFTKWAHAGEILRINCTDERALGWLTKAVEDLPKDNDTHYYVVREDQLPKLTKVTMFIPEAKLEGIDGVKKMLVAQNASIKINSWCLFYKEERDNGLLIVAGAVDEDIRAILAQDSRLFYEFSTLKIRIQTPAEAKPSTSASDTPHEVETDTQSAPMS